MPNPNELHALGFLSESMPSLDGPLYKPIGCGSCSNTGYRGRVAIHEVMTVTEGIERLAVARASSAEIARLAIEQGMQTLRQDGWAKAQLGITSVDEILRVVA
jgi:type IV pilus assembly protein PilB